MVWIPGQPPPRLSRVPGWPTAGGRGRSRRGRRHHRGPRESIRYIGIDTPETSHPTKGVEAYGKEAKEANRKLVAGKKVRLEFDVQRRDQYGRLLAYVYLEDGTFVNARLVEQGCAQVMTVPPNVKYQEIFLKLQREARKSGRRFGPLGE